MADQFFPPEIPNIGQKIRVVYIPDNETVLETIVQCRRITAPGKFLIYFVGSPDYAFYDEKKGWRDLISKRLNITIID